MGALYGPGLVAHGLALSRLVFVRAPDAALAFWAIEEALKCGAPGVVVGEIWSLKGYSLAASRRLLLAARKGETPALLILASAYGQAERLSSAAETRFEIAAAPAPKFRRRQALTCPGPSPAERGSSSRASRVRDPRRLLWLWTRGASSVSNGEART